MSLDFPTNLMLRRRDQATAQNRAVAASLLAAPLVAALLLTSCQSNEKASTADPDRPILEDRQVLDTHRAELQKLQEQFRGATSVYDDMRRDLLAKEPRVAPWLAKWMVSVAVADADRMIAQGLVPERIVKVPKFYNRPLFRARRELVALGPTGRRAIIVYMLRERRTQLRNLGRFLLAAHDDNALRTALLEEFEKGNEQSRRETLQLLGEIEPDETSRALLTATLGEADWQMRGTAIRALGAFAKKSRDKSDFLKTAWRLHREDSDEWVRGRALLALSDAEAVDQVRPIIERLEALMRENRSKEIPAAIEALRKLTGRDYGSNVSRWREWLEGSSSGRGGPR